MRDAAVTILRSCSSAGVQSGSRFPATLSRRRRFHEPENIFPRRRSDLFPDRRHAWFEACLSVGSGSERLVSSDVGKRGCSSYCGVPSFRGPEAGEEKLESAVLIRDRSRAIREAKKLFFLQARQRKSSVASVYLISTIELR